MILRILFYYLLSLLAIYFIFSLSQSVSERFNRGIIIKNKKLRKFLWIAKNEVYISYVSLVFVILGYIYLLAFIPCNIICLLVSNDIAESIAAIYLLLTCITGIVEYPMRYIPGNENPPKI